MKERIKNIYSFLRMKYQQWLLRRCDKADLTSILEDKFTDQLLDQQIEIYKLESKILDLEQELDTAKQVLEFKEAYIEILEKHEKGS